MRAFWLLMLFFGSIATCGASPALQWRSSPDRQWTVAWSCKGTWQPDSCSIALSRRDDGRVFFSHHTSDRYIQAVWSRDSRRCVLLDAPDNANSFLWLFRVRGRDIVTEKLDYAIISDAIESYLPPARRTEPAMTRSGIEELEWRSDSQLRLHMVYNDVHIIVLIDITIPRAPKARVLSHRET